MLILRLDVINRRFERLQLCQFRLYARPVAIFKKPMEIVGAYGGRIHIRAGAAANDHRLRPAVAAPE
jgi:hypothetical protein